MPAALPVDDGEWFFGDTVCGGGCDGSIVPVLDVGEMDDGDNFSCRIDRRIVCVWKWFKDVLNEAIENGVVCDATAPALKSDDTAFGCWVRAAY